MMPSQAMPTRVPFGPGPPFAVFGPGPSMQQGPPPLAPSAVPRNFGVGPQYDPAFRAMGPGPATSPIGPPSKTPQQNLSSTAVAPPPSKRASIGDPGPVARPIAPIARPTGEARGLALVRLSAVPQVRKVYSVHQHSRQMTTRLSHLLLDASIRLQLVRAGNPSPRSAIGENRAPWGAPSTPSFASPRPPVGNSLWGNTSPGPEWQHPPNNFLHSPFVTGPSPPPHPNT